MDFKFYLDKNYIAYYVLNRKMYNEKTEIKDIKEKLISNNSLGYKKILNKKLLDISIYKNDLETNSLINELILNEEFIDYYEKQGTEDIFSAALDLLNNKKPGNDDLLVNLKNHLWDKHRNGYMKIKYNFSWMIEKHLEDSDIKQIIDEFVLTEEFKKIFLETQKYMELVKKEWEVNKHEINEYLKEILKINFSIEPDVYIVHPYCSRGNFVENKIVWGHYNGINDSNYNLTYLVHEGLHCLLPYSISDLPESVNITHSIIELISDYELYSKLKKESTIEEGHLFLKSYRDVLYPYWLEYIGLTPKEKIERERKDNIVTSTIKSEEIRNMNIIEFINHCCIEYNKYNELDKKSINK